MGDKMEKKPKAKPLGLDFCNEHLAFIVFLVLILLVIGFNDE
jgi:hypothetical protein